MNGFARNVVLLLNGGRPFPHRPSGAALTGSPHRAAKIAPRRRQFPGHHRQASDQYLSAFSIRGAASVGAADWNKGEFTTSAILVQRSYLTHCFYIYYFSDINSVIV